MGTEIINIIITYWFLLENVSVFNIFSIFKNNINIFFF